MANIIPMAGIGSRFSEAGYLLPKPLIPVSGKPMILKAIERMPPSNKWVFIVRKEHIDQYQIDKLLKKNVKNAIIVPVDKTTEGQASSCMLAMPYLDKDEPVFIAACDNSFLYDKKMFDALVSDKTVDGVVWTFTKDKLLTENPKAWGWVALEKDNKTIKDISVKVPVSDKPYNDHAIVASFYFRKAKDFIAAYELMYKENYRINNEFYVDSIPLFYRKLGKRCVIFDVDLYVGWGKPKDLYEYQEEEYLFSNGQKSKRNEKWKKYFEND